LSQIRSATETITQHLGDSDLLVETFPEGMFDRIIHDPPVMIFDEPTSGLDVLVARALLKTIDLLKDQGKCIIFSTHIMREVEKLCDRVAIIHKGRILAEGSVAELQGRYRQPDMEELFFDLISKSEQEPAVPAC
jgi:sodium transport system ATP-binding protein